MGGGRLCRLTYGRRENGEEGGRAGPLGPPVFDETDRRIGKSRGKVCGDAAQCGLLGDRPPGGAVADSREAEPGGRDWPEAGLVMGERVVLLQTDDHMNLSGESVRPALDWLKCDIEDLAVVCDDLDLPPGTLRLRKRAVPAATGDCSH